MKYYILLVLLLLCGVVALTKGCACTRELMPVCARQGRRFRTFGNKCMLRAENNCHGGEYRFVHDGDCREN